MLSTKTTLLQKHRVRSGKKNEETREKNTSFVNKINSGEVVLADGYSSLVKVGKDSEHSYCTLIFD